MLPVRPVDHVFPLEFWAGADAGMAYAWCGLCRNKQGEQIMIVRRRTWFYRLAGENFAHAITFKLPVTATKVRDALRKSVGAPLELWGRSVY